MGATVHCQRPAWVPNIKGNRVAALPVTGHSRPGAHRIKEAGPAPGNPATNASSCFLGLFLANSKKQSSLPAYPQADSMSAEGPTPIKMLPDSGCPSFPNFKEPNAGGCKAGKEYRLSIYELGLMPTSTFTCWQIPPGFVSFCKNWGRIAPISLIRSPRHPALEGQRGGWHSLTHGPNRPMPPMHAQPGNPVLASDGASLGSWR